MTSLAFRFAVALTLFAASPVSAAPPRESQLVSVFPLVVRGAFDDNDKAAFEDLVRDRASTELQVAGFRVLLNETQLKVLADNGIDEARLAKACEQSCELAAAKELNVRLFLSGAIVHGSDGLLVAIRLFDGTDGTLVSSLELEARTATELRSRFKEASHGFFEHALKVLGAGRAKPSGSEGQADAQVAFGTGILSVRTTPPGAALTVDGRAFGTAPAFDDLPAGTHRIVAALDGYAEGVSDVRVESGQTSKVALELARLLGKVTFLDQMPVEAACTVGERSVVVAGGDLAEVELPVGRYDVRCEASGRVAYADAVTVRAREHAKVELNLDELPKGPPLSDRACDFVGGCASGALGLLDNHLTLGVGLGLLGGVGIYFGLPWTLASFEGQGDTESTTFAVYLGLALPLLPFAMVCTERAWNLWDAVKPGIGSLVLGVLWGALYSFLGGVSVPDATLLYGSEALLLTGLNVLVWTAKGDDRPAGEASSSRRVPATVFSPVPVRLADGSWRVAPGLVGSF